MSDKAKQEAERLVEKFRTAHSEKLSDYTFIEYPTAKVLALICVQERIDDLDCFVFDCEKDREYQSLYLLYLKTLEKAIEEL